MQGNLKVSIIIPIYNADEYLRECLDSVINQTLKDIEIICINDGSIDESLSILEEYAKKDNRIRIINQENSGSGAARNNGINNALGEFVAFMDSDDWYPNNDILYVLYQSAKEHSVQISGGSFSSSNGHTTKTKYYGLFVGNTFDKNGVIQYRDYQFDYSYHRFIYNLKMLKENNIEFPNYSRFQDVPFFVKAMIQAQEFYALSMITYCYRSGHRTINWDKRRINDLVKGIIDNLIMSRKFNLAKLHYLTVQRINSEYLKPIINNIDRDNLELISLLIKANNLIDIEMVKRESSDFPDNYILEPLKQAIFPVKKISRVQRSLTYLPQKSAAFIHYCRISGFKSALGKTYEEIRRLVGR